MSRTDCVPASRMRIGRRVGACIRDPLANLIVNRRCRSNHRISSPIHSASPIVERRPIIFIHRETRFGAGIDLNGERLVDRVARVLLHRSQRQDRPRAHVQRHRLERDELSSVDRQGRVIDAKRVHQIIDTALGRTKDNSRAMSPAADREGRP